jgi:hypothetical protein
MKLRSWPVASVFALAALLTAFLVLGPGCGGDDDNPEAPTDGVPEEWVGLWEMSITFNDCDSHEEIFTFTVTTPVCPDEEDYQDEEPGMDCDYSWDGDEMVAHCITYDTSGTCYETSDVQWTGTVSGTSFTAVGTMQTTYSPEGCDTAFCAEIEISATRIGDAPEPCDPYQDWGGGDDGGRAGLAVDIVGGSSDGSYEVADFVALVLLDTVANEYSVTASWGGGGEISVLRMAFPQEGGGPEDPWEFSIARIEGKAYVAFRNVVGSDLDTLSAVTSGYLTITEATDEAVSGSFFLTGSMVDALGVGDPEAIAFQNGTFELSVDETTGSPPGKTAPAHTFAEQTLSKVGIDALRMIVRTR